MKEYILKDMIDCISYLKIIRVFLGVYTIASANCYTMFCTRCLSLNHRTLSLAKTLLRGDHLNVKGNCLLFVHFPTGISAETLMK